MSESEINKVLRPGRLIHIFTIIVVLITIGLIGGSFIVGMNERKNARSLGELIDANEDKPGICAKVNMAYMPYGFAQEDEDKFYYFAMDSEQFMYIVRITENTYKKLEEMYNNGEGNIDYEFTGYTYSIPSKLKKLAIESANEAIQDEGNKLTYSNFNDYVGSVYLDETLEPEGHITNNLLAFGIIAGVFAIVLVFASVSQLMRARKLTKNTELMEELRQELADLDDNPYKKLNMYLTRKYIISKSGGISVYEYKDVIWEYATVRYVNGVAQGRSLMLCTKDKKKYTMAGTGANDTAIDEIMTEIKDKNPEVRIGFTKENREFFKNYKKEIM